MKIYGIDDSRCTKCEACVRNCPADLFVSASDGQSQSVSEKRPPEWRDPHGWCIGCGHCTAVCPADAIEYELERDEAAFGDRRASGAVPMKKKGCWAAMVLSTAAPWVEPSSAVLSCSTKS